MSKTWVSLDIRDAVVSFVDRWRERTGRGDNWFCQRIGIRQERLLEWRGRSGLPNAHATPRPKDFWLSEEERGLIVKFYMVHRWDGYRRCAYMMIDGDVVYASPSTVYRVLKDAAVLRLRCGKASGKGKGFDQPLRPHEHWHTDISYVKIGEIFYFLICVLDGYSRYIVSWDIRHGMKDSDVGVVHQRAMEAFPSVKPRVITDNGKQFTGKEFKEFIGLHGLTHVRTSPYYPQSNGKIERFHKTIKSECVRPKAIVDLDHAKEVVAPYVEHYNHKRLHSAISYVAPADRLHGRDVAILAERDRKLSSAREARNKMSGKVEATPKTALPGAA
jgi:transposase InsO family protein